jgi:hypothetical protein
MLIVLLLEALLAVANAELVTLLPTLPEQTLLLPAPRLPPMLVEIGQMDALLTLSARQTTANVTLDTLLFMEAQPLYSLVNLKQIQMLAVTSSSTVAQRTLSAKAMQLERLVSASLDTSGLLILLRVV